MANKLIVGERVFETSDFLAVGDYGGAGSTGEANIRFLEKELAEKVVALSVSQVTQLDCFLKTDEIKALNALLAATDADENGLITVRPAWGGDNAITTLSAIRGQGGCRPEFDGSDCVHDRSLGGTLGTNGADMVAAADLVVLSGAYGYRQAFLSPEKAPKILVEIARYPVLDDATETTVENEWERVAFDRDAKKELLAAITNSTIRERAETLSDDVLWELYQEVQGERAYPEIAVEYSGIYIKVDAIAVDFEAKVANQFTAQPKP